MLESGIKQRVGWIKKRTGRSYCDFLMFVHQRTREDNGHQCGKRFLIGIHKSVRWPCTYDNTDLLMAGSSSWPRTLDFHSKDQGFESPTRYRFIDITDICGGVKRIGTPEQGCLKIISGP